MIFKPHDEIIEVGVSMEGTWMKRGHSQLGAVFACACETGEIVDHEVMSLHCDKCNTFKAKHTKQEFQESKQENEESKQEFEEWWVTHKDSNECEINFRGNSGEMEGKKAAEVLFRRSEERVKLRYASLLGSSDTNTIKHINMKAYGPGFVVTKEECVGHVAKRFKTSLKTARQTKQPDATAKLVSMQGGGGMTEETTRILTRYYKGVILNNTGDVDGTKRDIFTIFYHTISADEDPHHELCPEGGRTMQEGTETQTPGDVW